ncbi:hypothetical protein PP713_08500 [Mycobacterium sp. CSUR Q5927]|nr:hypothetical protein [Mycobacterium sp. CSUR Q5927]
MRAKLSELFGQFRHDFDLFHPSAPAAPHLAGARAAGTSPLRLVPELVDRLAAPGPTHPGAASQPAEDYAREWLANLRAALVDAVALIDAVDPTPGGLAQAAAVTDLDAHRR